MTTQLKTPDAGEATWCVLVLELGRAPVIQWYTTRQAAETSAIGWRHVAETTHAESMLVYLLHHEASA